MILPPILLFGGVIAILIGRAIYESVILARRQKDAPREHDMNRVRSWFNDTSRNEHGTPERSWSDLDLDDVFRKIDRTVSWPGQHLLYARMRSERHTADSLESFEAGVQHLAGDDALRNRIRTALQPLANRRASALPQLFLGTLPAIPAIAVATPLLTLLGVACLAGIYWQPALILGIAFVAVVNAYVRVALREKINRVVPAARMLPAMLRAARALSTVDEKGLRPMSDSLRDAEPRLQWMARSARWFSFDATGGNELAGYIHEYLNILFLLDVSAFVWCVRRIVAEGETLRRAYVALGELDAMQSVATLRNERRDWCVPEFSGDAHRHLAFRELVHPLLENPVASTLALTDRNVLLTGSNMSGKSTFIRAVGVNAVLAQTIHTVFAAQWLSSRVAVRSSIGRADSLAEGTSYYRAEVNAVGELLTSTDDRQRLVLIDELFRGTNSIERVAAAKAVLAHLDGENATVIVATHDVELLELLPTYASFHFREEVRDHELTFDYQLHEGACSTRNAIAILALAGYPASVIEQASRTAIVLGDRVSLRAAPGQT